MKVYEHDLIDYFPEYQEWYIGPLAATKWGGSLIDKANTITIKRTAAEAGILYDILDDTFVFEDTDEGARLAESLLEHIEEYALLDENDLALLEEEKASEDWDSYGYLGARQELDSEIPYGDSDEIADILGVDLSELLRKYTATGEYFEGTTFDLDVDAFLSENPEFLVEDTDSLGDWKVYRAAMDQPTLPGLV